MTAPRGLRIAIVGAGIAGLAAAIGSARAGATVTVFEEAPAVRSGGSGLTVFSGGMRALDSLGLGAPFRDLTDGDVRLLRGGQRAPDGRWLARLPSDAVTEMRVVDRGDFHRLLVGAVPESVVIRTGARVISATMDGRVRWSCTDCDVHEEVFDLVVGADGMRSVVRQAFPDDPGGRYAGYGAWRGITSHPVDLRGEAGETWGVRTRFGMAPLSDGRVYWFAVATMPEDAVFHDEASAVDALFGSWHAPIPELIAATEPSSVHRLPILELAGELASFVRGRIALIGDAAHAMTPNLGQGGGQGLEDAAELCAVLGPSFPARPLRTPSALTASALTPSTPAPSAGDPEWIADALALYDARRRPRTQRIARTSRLLGDIAHRPGAGLSRVRDALLAAAPESALRAQARAVQEWSGPGDPPPLRTVRGSAAVR